MYEIEIKLDADVALHLYYTTPNTCIVSNPCDIMTAPKLLDHRSRRVVSLAVALVLILDVSFH